MAYSCLCFPRRNNEELGPRSRLSRNFTRSLSHNGFALTFVHMLKFGRIHPKSKLFLQMREGEAL